MKKKLVLMLVLTVLTMGCLLATDPSEWQENGIPIRQGVNIEWSRASAVLDNGSVVYVWSDTRNGGRDLWAQAVDETGVLWGESGILVCGKDDRQEDPVIIATSDGNAIIAWIDFELDTYNGGVFAQKINPQGELLWDSCIPLCTADGIQISLNIVPDNDGGAYIIWQDHRDGTVSIYGVHIDEDGDNYPGWPENGLALASGSGDQSNHTFWEDGQGGAILAYVNNDAYTDIHVKRILSDGEIAWFEVLAEGEQQHGSVRMSPFGSNAFGFAYLDRITGSDNVHVQALDIDGNFLWTESIPVYPGYSSQLNPRVAAAADGNFIVVWEDYRMGTSDLYVQKFDIAGNTLWDNDGMLLVSAAQDQKNPRIEPDASGGCYVVWDDARAGGHPEIDIYMQHVSAAGNLSWEVDGRAVALIPGETFAPLIKPTADHLFVSWGDGRTGSIGIYFQTYDLAGNQLLTDNGVQVYWGLSGDAEALRVVPNGEYIYVIWKDTRYAHFGDQIKVQKIDSGGNIHFEENGISVVASHSGTRQDKIQAIAHHNGGLVLSWTEQPSEFVLAYTQAIDADGNPLWGDQGLRTSTNDLWYGQDNPHVSYDGNGAYMVGWDETDMTSPDLIWPRNLRAQKVVNGQRVWDDEGVLLAYQTDNDLADHHLQSVVGSYFVWLRSDNEIYVKLLDEDGNVADGWDDYGNLVCVESSTRTAVKSIMTPEGLLVTWQDRRNGTSGIYGQLVSEEGDMLWQENGIPLADYDNDQSIISLVYDQGYFYLTWRDARINPSLQDVGMQKFDMNGNPLWGDPSPYVVTNDIEQNSPSMTVIGNRLLVTWENIYGEAGSNIHSQIVDIQSGNTLWNPDGIILCDAEKRQYSSTVVPFTNGFGFAAWRDGRSSGKEDIIGIFAQKVDTNFINVSDDTLVPLSHLQLRGNYPNPFNPETKISFDMLRNDHVSLRIYNVRGQLVRTMIDNEFLERGSHFAVWKGTDNNNKAVGSGVYFYQLQGENSNQVRKMLLLK
jgi:hypothetical protein